MAARTYWGAVFAWLFGMHYFYLGDHLQVRAWPARASRDELEQRDRANH